MAMSMTNQPTIPPTEKILFKLTLLGKKSGSYYRYLTDSFDLLQCDIDEIDEQFTYGVSSQGYAAGCIYWIDADYDQIEILNDEDWKACFGYALQTKKSIELFVIANYMVEFENITVAEALGNAGLKRSFIKPEESINFSTMSTVTSSGELFDDELVGAVGERALEFADNVYKNISKTRKDFEKRTNIMGSNSTLISSNHEDSKKELTMVTESNKYKKSMSRDTELMYSDLDMYEP